MCSEPCLLCSVWAEAVGCLNQGKREEQGLPNQIPLLCPYEREGDCYRWSVLRKAGRNSGGMGVLKTSFKYSELSRYFALWGVAWIGTRQNSSDFYGSSNSCPTPIADLQFIHRLYLCGCGLRKSKGLTMYVIKNLTKWPYVPVFCMIL